MKTQHKWPKSNVQDAARMSKLQLYDIKITKIFKVLRFGRLQMFSYQSFPTLSVICAAPRWIRGFVVEVFFGVEIY